MVPCLKRISIKAPAILAREIIRMCACLPSSVEKVQNESMGDASCDEADIVIEYDNIHPLRHWLTGILKFAAIAAVVAIVWIIKRG